MDEKLFKDRTKKFSLAIIHLVESLPHSKTADVIGRQLLRSGTSIGANYRAGCRAKSAADMINKFKIVEEEGDETLYWLELLCESGTVSQELIKPVMKECDELVAMTIASIRTLR